jgi:hypothetical protein
MTPLVESLLDAVPESMAALRARYSDIRWWPAADNAIAFSFDGRPYIGYLRGRNSDACLLGNDCEADRSLALRVMLDCDAYQS